MKTVAATARRSLRRWHRVRLVAVTMIASAIGFVAFLLSLSSLLPSDIADARLGRFAVASALDFTSIQNAGLDPATRSVVVGGPAGIGSLRLRLRVQSGSSWNRLFVTGGAPVMDGPGASVHLSIDGKTVGEIREPVPSPGPLIRIPSDPESGYHFAISSTACTRTCSIAIVTNGAQWRIDRVGVGVFRSSASPFEMVDRDPR